MYKRNVKPLEEFLRSLPPPERISSIAATESSTTSRARSQGRLQHARTGTVQPCLSRCLVVGQIWRSRQNGMVYDPDGISPCICVGQHSGVEPKIIVYEKDD